MEQQWRAIERFKSFSLRVSKEVFLLPPRHSLVVDRLLSTMLLIDWQNEQVVGNGEAMDDEQFALVLTLLERWPSYVPYEQLFPHLGIPLTNQETEALERVRTSGWAEESDEEQAQDKLAQEQLQPILQTLRELLHDCKTYLHDFGIDIIAVLDYGPLLIQSHEVEMPQVEESAKR